MNKKSESSTEDRYYVDNDLAQKIKQENIKVHEKEAEIYDILHSEIFNRSEQKNTSEDVKFILKNIQHKKPPYVLDIGCGTGNLSLKFLKYGCKVTGIDISRKMLEMLRAKTQSNLLRLENIDIDLFLSKTKDRYDVICFSSVLHHLPDFMGTIANTRPLLNNEGAIYITHEPLRKNDNSINFLNRAIIKIDSLLFIFLLKLKRIELSIDYTYSDYHCENGIDIKDIAEHLKNNGFEIIYAKEFNVCKFAIFTYLDDKFNKNKRLFKIIAKKIDI